MFTMMNSARLNVGLEGVAVGEAAPQAVVAYAKEPQAGFRAGRGRLGTIINHPDMQRTPATWRPTCSRAGDLEGALRRSGGYGGAPRRCGHARSRRCAKTC